MGRRIAVRFLMWALAHGLTGAEASRALQLAFPWHDGEWRLDVLNEAGPRVIEREKARKGPV